MDTKVADPLHGALLGGRYRIMGRLARGGMATVYQARDERLERAVAVKIIHPDHARDPHLLSRLADEAKTVARLTHPNIVAVFDEGTHDGMAYLVLEYVRGRTLRAVLDDRRRLDPAESLAVLEQLLAALAVAHRAGLVHRDVKPENILVAPPPNGSGDLVDSVVKVADFGLAHTVEITGRQSGSSDLLGTAEYVAPELVSDGRADARSDVYSTGIVLFEMLTGRVPFEGDRSADIAWQHVDHDVPPPSRLVPGLPQMLDDVVVRATKRDPAGRPRDAAALLAEVQAARENVSALAGPTRALAHPTVIVAPVPPSGRISDRTDRDRTDRGDPRLVDPRNVVVAPVAPSARISGQPDPRPSWARLPNSRGGAAAAPPPAPTRGRVYEPKKTSGLDALRTSVRRQLDALRNSARGRRQLTAAVVVIGLLLVGGGWYLGFGRYTEAPDLVRLTQPNAAQEAERLGFKLQLGTGRYDEVVPKDTVLTQSPPANSRIVKGGTVTVSLSLGAERYQVPSVAGQAVDVATERLQQQKLVVQTRPGFSDTLPANFVSGTDPPEGTAVKPNDTVTLIVVAGPFPVHIPTVVGKTKAEAQAALAGYVVEFNEVDDPSQKKDVILDQNPPGGQGLETNNGVKVILTVAKGPAGVPVPRVLDQPCSAVAGLLQAQGFVPDIQGNDIEKTFGKARVQTPLPDVPAPPGSVVQVICQVF